MTQIYRFDDQRVLVRTRAHVLAGLDVIPAQGGWLVRVEDVDEIRSRMVAGA